MAKNKETTIDDLAVMVQKGFQSMDEKMDKRFTKLEGRMEGMENRMEGIEDRVGIIETQIDKLQRGQVRIEDRLDEVAPRIKDHEKRIIFLEKKALPAR